MPPRAAILLLAALSIAGCVGVEPDANAYLYNYGRTTSPRPEGFVHCYDFTCRTTVPTSISRAELAPIGRLFATPSTSAADERARLAQAIAIWEQVIGGKTGTSADIGSESGDKFAGRFQQDCMDETFNTTSYLMMMRDAGWMRFHRVVYPSSRGFFSALDWPHHAATLEETASKRRYVFDSWFYDNGNPPVVMPVEIWEKGWTPSRNGPWRGE